MVVGRKLGEVDGEMMVDAVMVEEHETILLVGFGSIHVFHSGSNCSKYTAAVRVMPTPMSLVVPTMYCGVLSFG